MDIDMVLWRRENDGLLYPKAITDITRTDKEDLPDDEEKLKHYTSAITYRLFIRDFQGEALDRLGELLKAPVYFVLFPPSVSWLHVYSFQTKSWKHYTQKEWAEFLQKI